MVSDNEDFREQMFRYWMPIIVSTVFMRAPPTDEFVNLLVEQTILACRGRCSI